MGKQARTKRNRESDIGRYRQELNPTPAFFHDGDGNFAIPIRMQWAIAAGVLIGTLTSIAATLSGLAKWNVFAFQAIGALLAALPFIVKAAFWRWAGHYLQNLQKKLSLSSDPVDQAKGFLMRFYGNPEQLFSAKILQTDPELMQAVTLIMPGFQLNEWEGKPIVDLLEKVL